jgi:hypothetical protein
MERFTDSQTWFAVFDGSTERRWWNLFLHERWRHVLLWRQLDDGVLCINPLSHVLAVRHYTGAVEHYIGQEIEQKCSAVLSLTVHYSMVYERQLLDWVSCVSIAKRILGIRKRVITPKGLHKAMLKAGAQEIYHF